MYRGKYICKTLKEVRRKIAKANDIVYEPTECRHEGDCLGTCPKCEAEVRYLEQQLDLRRSLGKAVSLVGISVGITAVSSCSLVRPLNPTAGDVMPPPDTIEEVAGIPPAPDLQPAQVEEGDTVNEEALNSLVVPTDSLEANIFFGDVQEVQPAFPGGNGALRDYLSRNIVYPEQARKDSVEGRVVVSFVIEKDGSITKPAVVRSLHPLLDAEALRVVAAMPKWSPGMTMGKKVEVKYNLPVSFKLND